MNDILILSILGNIILIAIIIIIHLIFDKGFKEKNKQIKYWYGKFNKEEEKVHTEKQKVQQSQNGTIKEKNREIREFKEELRKIKNNYNRETLKKNNEIIKLKKCLNISNKKIETLEVSNKKLEEEKQVFDDTSKVNITVVNKQKKQYNALYNRSKSGLNAIIRKIDKLLDNRRKEVKDELIPFVESKIEALKQNKN